MAVAAAENAADWKGVARGLGGAGSVVSVFTGGYEAFTADNPSDAAHGLTLAGVGVLAGAGVIGAPAAVAFGVADAAVQHVDYTSPITGQTTNGWSALNAAGADGISTQYQRDLENGPVVY